MNAPFALPGAIADLTAGGTWRTLHPEHTKLGWIVDRDKRAPLWVRAESATAPSGPGSIPGELERLEWARVALADVDISVPEVVAVTDGDDAFPSILVTVAAPGESDLRMLPGADDPLRILAETLRAFHELPIADCPFPATPEACIDHVRARVDAKEIDVKDLHDVYQRSTPESLVGHLQTMAPKGTPSDDLVMMHGNISVHSLRVDPYQASLTGVLGWGWAGVGDRHFDLAVAARSVMAAFGGEAVGGLFARYGSDAIDPMRLEFYGLVDELR